MIYRRVDCPHCGNEITVKSVPEDQKCRWCRRLVKATFSRNKGKKWRVEVEPVDFPTNNKRYDDERIAKKQSYNRWMDGEIYGVRH